jgi:hypothetical protein
MKNKILSLVLALLMAASSASAVLANEEVVAIAEEEAVVEVAEEVEAGQYDKAIEFLANYGIFKGYDKNNTGAEDLIQRYQMALFVARIATGWTEDEVWEDGPENWSEFSDIDFAPVNSYYGALSFANQKGIIEGYGNGKFGPTDSITYQNALTMVVRTLGYTGLDWPWGYIQKAVELGLTDGITGVAYTDELTRGEVAQIVYNALFAKMKDGSNLALKNFGIEFGWEKVVITASDRNSFVKLGEKESTKVDSKFVEFKLLEDDGTLADDAYLALAADFDLDTAKHEDDLAVGNAYYVLFEKDADSELAKIVAVESLLVDVIENEGKLNLTEDEEYPIQAFLADYTLVDKYTTNEYLNATKSGKDELLVWDAIGGITEDVVDGYAIAIDWNNGNILGYEYDKNGKPVDQNDDEKIDKEDYKVQWFYNELLDRYYEEQYDKKTGEFLGINYMTDEEFEKFYESTAIKVATPFKGFTAITSIAKTAYATLELFDTDLNGVADRALYESYKLGKFTLNSDNWCCDAYRTSYKLEAVNTFANSVKAADKGNDGEKLVINGVNPIAEGTCEHGKAFFVEGYTPVVDEEGAYVNGYVIYNYDAETGAIKVVKNIGEDADSYVATGVLRAYNVNNETLTIGEEKLSMNYDELAGTGFYLVNKNSATKAAYTGLLRSLFNQFVKYVVVDGEVVHIEAAGKNEKAVIIVDSYAGLSSDGYIVVNGYHTDDLVYGQFKIGSYDGWQRGDYYYYLDDATAKASFTKGTIYSIASQDDDVYYVNLAGSWDKNFSKYTVEAGVKEYAVSIVAAEDNYMDYTNNAGTVKTRKMSSDDQYVIIPAVYDEAAPVAPLYVYTGKLPQGATITGTRIDSDSYDNTTYVIIDATVTGLVLDTYKTGLVLLESDKYFVADYNGTDAEDWYLLGASTYTVEGFDLLTGDADAVYTATNLKLKAGHIYFAQNGVLVEDLGVLEGVNGLVATAFRVYPNQTVATGNYIFGSFVIDEDNYANLFETVEKVTRQEFIADKAGINTKYGHTKYRETVDDVLVYTFTYDEDGVVTAINSTSKSKIADAMEDYTEWDLYVNYVYEVETENIVCYISLVEGDYNTVEVEEDLEITLTAKEYDVDDDGKAEATLKATVVYDETKVNGVVSKHSIKGVKLAFDLADDETKHTKIEEYGWHFGWAGKDTIVDANEEDYMVVYNVTTTNPADVAVVGNEVLHSIVTGEYDVYKTHDADCADCTLVQAVYVDFEKAVDVLIHDWSEDGKTIVNAQNFGARVQIVQPEDLGNIEVVNVAITNGLNATSDNFGYVVTEAITHDIAE